VEKQLKFSDMDLKDILAVNLTAEDFEVLLEGLSAIPEKGMVGELVYSSLMLRTAGNNENRKTEIMKQMEKRIKVVEQKNESRQEVLTILKGKLILLKRLLLSNDAVRQATEILKNSGGGGVLIKQALWPIPKKYLKNLRIIC
jgi:hypothetical protein